MPIGSSGQGRGVVRDRTHTFLPHPDPGREYEFKSMEGGLEDSGVYALRIASDILEHPVVAGLIFLFFRIQDGALLAILQDGLIQGMRVAATTALAARYLARPDSRVMGLSDLGGKRGTTCWPWPTPLPWRRSGSGALRSTTGSSSHRR